MTCNPRLYTSFGVECATCGARAAAHPTRSEAMEAWKATPCGLERRSEYDEPGFTGYLNHGTNTVHLAPALPSADATADRDPGDAPAGLPEGAGEGEAAQVAPADGDAPVPPVRRSRRGS